MKFDLDMVYSESRAAAEELDRKRYEEQKEKYEAQKLAQEKRSAELTAKLNSVADRMKAETQQRMNDEILEARDKAEAEVRAKYAKNFGEIVNNDQSKRNLLLDMGELLRQERI